MNLINIFYTVLNAGYRLLFGRKYMLHAPLYTKEGQTLFQAQCAFVDHCLSFLPAIRGLQLLDIGCGNGLQTLYIAQNYHPSFIQGIDPVNHQIKIARRNAEDCDEKVQFYPDDAQHLTSVADRSMDIVICLESSLHFPDKDKFLSQVARVLKPGGHILIGDLLSRVSSRGKGIRKLLQMDSWTHQQYLEAFQRCNIRLELNQPLNELLLESLQRAPGYIREEFRIKSSAAGFLKMLLVKPVLGLYKMQLKHHLEYRLFVGQIDASRLASFAVFIYLASDLWMA